MAEVELAIGGHLYAMSCADGEEETLRALAGMVDERVHAARDMAGSLTETRQLLFAAILLADELSSAGRPAEARADDDTEAAARIDAVTARMERLAERLDAILRTDA